MGVVLVDAADAVFNIVGVGIGDCLKRGHRGRARAGSSGRGGRSSRGRFCISVIVISSKLV